MTTKSCTQCDQPRMVSASGKTLTMCETHQRAYWRSKKPKTKRPHKQPVTTKHGRRCKVCQQRKPLSEFGAWGMGYKRTCLDCEAQADSTPTQPKQEGKHIVVVDGNQVMLARVVSQVPSVRQKHLVIDLYRQRGYEVMHVFEREAQHVTHS